MRQVRNLFSRITRTRPEVRTNTPVQRVHGKRKAQQSTSPSFLTAIPRANYVPAQDITPGTAIHSRGVSPGGLKSHESRESYGRPAHSFYPSREVGKEAKISPKKEYYRQEQRKQPTIAPTFVQNPTVRNPLDTQEKQFVMPRARVGIQAHINTPRNATPTQYTAQQYAYTTPKQSATVKHSPSELERNMLALSRAKEQISAVKVQLHTLLKEGVKDIQKTSLRLPNDYSTKHPSEDENTQNFIEAVHCVQQFNAILSSVLLAEQKVSKAENIIKTQPSNLSLIRNTMDKTLGSDFSERINSVRNDITKAQKSLSLSEIKRVYKTLVTSSYSSSSKKEQLIQAGLLASTIAKNLVETR